MRERSTKPFPIVSDLQLKYEQPIQYNEMLLRRRKQLKKVTNPLGRIDRWTRLEDTVITKTLHDILPLKGDLYSNSKQKQHAERIIGIAASGATAQVVLGASIVTILDSGLPPLYRQMRIGKEGKRIPVCKIRTMYPDAHRHFRLTLRNHDKSEDKRVTRFGKLLRDLNIDELPQLWSVALGKLGITGIRALPQYVYDHMKESRPEVYEKWKEATEASKPGILNLYSVINSDKNNESGRYRADIFYREHASLAFDVYMAYRAGRKMYRRVKRRIVNARKSKDTTQIPQ